jgi:hypothetical protein
MSLVERQKAPSAGALTCRQEGYWSLTLRPLIATMLSGDFYYATSLLVALGPKVPS